MLKQDAVPETQAAPVGQARVTPDELAQALAAIDARRQAEAAHLAGTIPIEQAVSDLHLDSTPDEIWAEVQAQRAGSATVPQTAPAATVPPVTRRRRWRGLIAPVLVVWGLFHYGVIPHHWGRHVSVTAPHMSPLSVIPNGTEVYANTAALEQIASGTPFSQISVGDTQGDNQWRLVKIGSHVYVRGYIAEANSLSGLQGNSLNVYNDDNSGGLFGKDISTIRVRIDKTPLMKSGGDADYSEFTLPSFHQDPATTLDQ